MYGTDISYYNNLMVFMLQVKESLGERVLLCHQLLRVEKTLSEGGKPVWVSTFQTPTGVKVSALAHIYVYCGVTGCTYLLLC